MENAHAYRSRRIATRPGRFWSWEPVARAGSRAPDGLGDPGLPNRGELTCGLIGYPRRSFVLGTALAGVLWASYPFFIGPLGGQAFEGRSWAGLLVGLGLTLVVSGVIEAAHRLRQRARARRGPRPAPASGRVSSADRVVAPEPAPPWSTGATWSG